MKPGESQSGLIIDSESDMDIGIGIWHAGAMVFVPRDSPLFEVKNLFLIGGCVDA